MAFGDLPLLKQFFAADDDADTRRELFRETLLMTLSRGTRADASTDDDEVKAVQAILQRYLNEQVSAKDIRVAASSELYEKAPIDKCLAEAATRIDLEGRQTIATALIEVFRADGKVASAEVEFFNMAATALKLTPAELLGLEPS